MFNLDPGTLALTMFFSIIGIGYFSYGKKRNFYFLLSGIALMIYPYFVNQMLSLFIFGVILVVLPFVLDRVNPL